MEVRVKERSVGSVGREERIEEGAVRGGWGMIRGWVVGWKWDIILGRSEVRADSREEGVEAVSMVGGGGEDIVSGVLKWRCVKRKSQL